MSEHGVYRILGHTKALGPQVFVQSMDAEAAHGLPESMADKPAQSGHLRHLITLHHVAEKAPTPTPAGFRQRTSTPSHARETSGAVGDTPQVETRADPGRVLQGGRRQN